MVKKYWYRACWIKDGRHKEETGTYELEGESPRTIIEDVIDTMPAENGTLNTILVWEMTEDGDLSPYTVASLRQGVTKDDNPTRDKPIVRVNGQRDTLAPQNLKNPPVIVPESEWNTPREQPVAPKLSALLKSARWAYPATINTCYLGEFATVRPPRLDT